MISCIKRYEHSLENVHNQNYYIKSQWLMSDKHLIGGNFAAGHTDDEHYILSELLHEWTAD